MNVRWVPISGISSRAARNVPTSEPAVEIAYRPPVTFPVSVSATTVRRLAYGATAPSSITGTATRTSTAASDPRKPPTDRDPSAATDNFRNGSATNGTAASSTEASRTIAHSPWRSARRSASRPPIA